jgi:outer membrane protein TolC
MKPAAYYAKYLKVPIPVTFSLIILLLLTLPSQAVSAEGEGIKVLTLEEALQIASESNKDIQKALEYRNWVEGRYVEERAAALPQFTILGGATMDRDESQKAFGSDFSVRRNSGSVDLGLSQAVFTWGQTAAAIRAAKVGLATAEDQLRIFRQAAFRDVSAAFYDILLAKELHKIALLDLDQKGRHLDEARKKFAAGVATDYDILAARVTVENARPEVIRAENLIRIARERLRFLLGTDGSEVDVRGSLQPSMTPYPGFEEALEIALKNRPELADLHHRRQIGEELVKIAQAGDKPRVDLKAGYGWRYLDLGSGQNANGPAWLVGLYLTYPIFDGFRTQGQVSQAKSNVTTLKIEESKLGDGIRLEVRDAGYVLRDSEETIKALSGTVEQAERLLLMSEKGYEFGVKTRLDVDDAQLNLTSARGTLARAQRNYLVFRVNYEYVMGILGERKGQNASFETEDSNTTQGSLKFSQ